MTTGFVKVEAELLEAPISGEALALLLRMRRDSDQREADGYVEDRALDALMAYYGLKRRRILLLLGQLRDAGCIERVENGFKDVNFASLHRTHADREVQRQKWRTWQQNRRSSVRPGPMSGPDSTPESGVESGVESGASLSLSPSPSLSLSPSFARAREDG